MAIIITQLTKTLTPTITFVAMFLPVKLPVSSTRITGMERNECTSNLYMPCQHYSSKILLESAKISLNKNNLCVIYVSHIKRKLR